MTSRDPNLARTLLAAMGAATLRQLPAPGLNRHQAILRCPECRGALATRGAGLHCSSCERRYEIAEPLVDFASASTGPQTLATTSLDGVYASAPAAYESAIRPSFVLAMGGDDTFTTADEESYLSSVAWPARGPVLDVACGPGPWTKLLARKLGGERVIGIDVSAAGLLVNQAQVPGGFFVRGSATKLPFADGSLGGASCSNSLQTFPDTKSVVLEIGRCLAPGGVFSAFTFRRAPAASAYRYFQQAFERSLDVHALDEGELREWLREGGMEVTDMRGPSLCLLFTATKK